MPSHGRNQCTKSKLRMRINRFLPIDACAYGSNILKGFFSARFTKRTVVGSFVSLLGISTDKNGDLARPYIEN